MTTHDVIIIGGGAAGLSAAAGTAQLGLKTALIDREKLGGDCLYYGCVPSKSLIKSSDSYYQLKKTKEYGLPRLEVPPADITEVLKRVQDIIKTIEPHDSPERFTSLGAEVYLTSARFEDPWTIRLEKGELLSAKKIILATGSSPRIPDIPGLNEAGFITHKEIFSLEKQPQHLITIGAGPIGVELSQSLLKLGSRVTLLSSKEGILAREDRDMAAYVEKNIMNEGGNIVSRATVIQVEKAGEKKVVHYEQNGKVHMVEADEILVSAGRRGNTEGLELEKAGVKVEKSFIVTDKYLRTSQKHIMAIGDCNGNHLFTHVAGAEGSLAVKKAAFGLKSKMDYSIIPWCTYTKPELASIGLNEKRAKEQGIKYTVVEAPMEDIDRPHAEGSTTGKIKILLDKKDRIIGTQIAADHAGELILPSLFTHGKKLMTLMSPVYPYPTLGEIHRKAAGLYYGPKLFNSRTRKILKFLFRYRGIQ